MDKNPNAIATSAAETSELDHHESTWPKERSDDVAAARPRQEAAEFQRLHYQELFDHAPECYLVTDAHGVILEANHAAAELLQTPREMVSNTPLAFFVAPGRRATFYNRLAQAIKGEPVPLWETRLQPPRGETRYAKVSFCAFPDLFGRPAGFGWLLCDITASRQLEQQHQVEQNLADGLLDTLEAGVLVIDDQNRIQRSNPFLHDLTGHSAHDLRGRDWVRVLLPDSDHARGREMIHQALALGAFKGGVLELRARDGGRRAMAWSARALIERLGESKVVLVGYDVTDLRDAQQRALQVERLAAVGQMVAGLAHESRNALQRIQSCVAMLGFRVKDQPEAIELLGRLQKAQDDLTRLFETVREYSAPLKLEPQTCDLATIWQEAWADLGEIGQGGELREETANLDLRCQVSPFHMKQVFRNLLENALAACGSGARLAIRAKPAELDGRNAVCLTVSDNGPGFTPEQRKKAFEPFFTTKARGSGLGLPICKRIVEAHGGRIEVRDQPGPGAEIVLVLPRRAP